MNKFFNLKILLAIYNVLFDIDNNTFKDQYLNQYYTSFKKIHKYLCYIFIKYKILTIYYIISLGEKFVIICLKIYKMKFQSHIGLMYGSGINFY
jgi:hypothetical protein